MCVLYFELEERWIQRYLCEYSISKCVLKRICMILTGLHDLVRWMSLHLGKKGICQVHSHWCMASRLSWTSREWSVVFTVLNSKLLSTNSLLEELSVESGRQFKCSKKRKGFKTVLCRTSEAAGIVFDEHLSRTRCVMLVWYRVIQWKLSPEISWQLKSQLYVNVIHYVFVYHMLEDSDNSEMASPVLKQRIYRRVCHQRVMRLMKETKI